MAGMFEAFPAVYLLRRSSAACIQTDALFHVFIFFSLAGMSAASYLSRLLLEE